MNQNGNAQSFLAESTRIVGEAAKQGLTLRVMGACAVLIHCPKYRHLLTSLGREVTDMDFVSYSKYNLAVEKFFRGIEYNPKGLTMALRGTGRHIYDRGEMHVDVFFDKLDMCHCINFSGRLEMDSPTIPLAELLLEKMQIVQINEKDLKDTMILLREHEAGESDNEQVNKQYLSELLSQDWGFYHTVRTNLELTKNYLTKYDSLPSDDVLDVGRKIDQIIKSMDEKPKSFKWKMRAKIGTSQKWYKDIE